MKIQILIGCLVVVGCASLSPIDRTQYPEHWWQKVEAQEAADWEILPQEAGPREVILSKRNELGILSNFAATPFKFAGKTYASVEGFWQMMKFPEGANDERAKLPVQWPYTREQVAQMIGFEAKRAGNKAEEIMKNHGIDWITFQGRKLAYRGKDQGEHYQIIRQALEAKVAQNPVVKQVLIGTGKLVLRPDHKVNPNSPKAWRYYDIYMDIRRNL